ncbi:hypothetical protein TGRH88_087858 [Toxoplasma gondii]|uniref:EGF-like domain-containing protein n=1 Tax=Toxoplasma gondii TaxID=5811 RepID=A0A7J6JVK0_TOXGO|nr:hypothetical protein TGRH88_087858 [Toxoplasma gondii]
MCPRTRNTVICSPHVLSFSRMTGDSSLTLPYQELRRVYVLPSGSFASPYASNPKSVLRLLEGLSQCFFSTITKVSELASNRSRCKIQLEAPEAGTCVMAVRSHPRTAVVRRKRKELVIMDRHRSGWRIGYYYALLGCLLGSLYLPQAFAPLASALSVMPLELSLRSLEPRDNGTTSALSKQNSKTDVKSGAGHDGSEVAVNTEADAAPSTSQGTLVNSSASAIESEQASSVHPNPLLCKFVNLGETCGPGDGSGVSLYCLPGQCCVNSPDSLTPICSTDCNSREKPLVVFNIPSCTCRDQHYYCDVHASCIDNPTAGSGAYCRCAKGFQGDGLTCASTYCDGENPCGHGDCVPDKETTVGYTCNCNTGYLLITSPAPKCDKCEGQPCGPDTAVKECRPGLNGSYTCLCQDGYSLSEVNGRKLCHKFSSRCSASPCGADEAVQACRDTGESYECLCNLGYKLIKENNSPKCVEHNVCDADPCGPAHLVKECRPTDSGYSCVCADDAVLVGTMHQPFCVNRNPVPWLIAMGSVLGIIVLALVGVYLSREWQRRFVLETEGINQEQLER